MEMIRLINLRKLKNLFVLGSDVIIILGAYILSVLLKFEFMVPEGFLSDLWMPLFVALIIYIGTFVFFDLYRSLWAVAGYPDYLNIIKANFLSAGVLLILNTVIVNRFLYSVVIIAAFLILLGTLSIRMLFRVRRRFSAKKSDCADKDGNGMRNILIIGAGDAAALILKEIRNHPELRINIIGLVDDDDFKQHSRLHGFSVLGRTEDMPEITKNQCVDEIIMAIPSCQNGERRRILKIAQSTGAKLKTLPGIYEMVDRGININSIRDVDITDLLGRKEIVLNNEKIAEYIENKVVLVTGGGGSIGSELCRQISALKPKRLIILDVYENGAYDIQNELKKNFPMLDLLVLIASVRDRNKVYRIFEKERPEIVFHAAAHKHVPLMETSPDEAIKNNVFGTKNVAMAAKEYKAERFILISTDKAVNPTNIMGASKRLCEMVIQNLDAETEDTDYVAVRFGNVMDSNGSVIPLFRRQIKEGGPVTVTHKGITRFFMTIPEAVLLVLQAGSYAKGGEIYVLDMGEPIKIYDLAKNMIRLYGFEPHKDIEIRLIGLRPGEKLYEELLMAEEGLESTPNKLIFVGKPNGFESKTLKAQLRLLENLIVEDHETMEELKAVMMGIVSTYVPEMEITPPVPSRSEGLASYKVAASVYVKIS